MNLILTRWCWHTKSWMKMLLNDHDLLLFLSSCSAAVWQSTRGPQQMPHTQSSISPPLQTFSVISPGWRCDFTSIPYCSLAADLKIAVATQGRQHTIRHQPMPSLPTASPLLQVTQGMQHQVCSTVQIFRIKNRCYLHADARILVTLADTILPLILNNVRIRVHHD